LADPAPFATESSLSEGARHPPRLLWAAGIAALAVAMVLLTGVIIGRRPFAFDRAILLALRVPGDTGTPIGPDWLRRAMVDLTALGGPTVLVLVVALTFGLLATHRLWLTAWLTLAATATGATIVELVKLHVDRARPEIVPHLVEAAGYSFPSGHSTSSAIVYLTIAGLVTQITRGASARTYVLACAILLVTVIGISRVYLGVHWPSDVLAGWSFGTLWALAWWLLGARVRRALG